MTFELQYTDAKSNARAGLITPTTGRYKLLYLCLWVLLVQ